MSGPAPDRRHFRVARRHHAYAFDPAARPVLTVPDGALVTFATLDCFGNRISRPDQRFRTDAALLAAVGGYNPVTGPVAVAGAEPGDRLEVAIRDIRLGTAGAYAVTVSFGAAKGDSRIVAAACPGLSDEGHTRICPLDGDDVLFPTAAGTLRLPVRPMVGTVGTAPATGPVPSLRSGNAYGGNMDCPYAAPGALLTLPVTVPGALLSVGDVHALMGDAEITGTALETSADVTVQVRIRRGAAGDGPREAGAGGRVTPWLDDGERVGAIGCADGASLDANLQTAMSALHARLRREYHMRSVDAYELLGAVAVVRVNQCVVGGWTSVYAGVPRRVLPNR